MTDPDVGLSPLRVWLCQKIDAVFPFTSTRVDIYPVFETNGSCLRYTDSRYKEWTGWDQKQWETKWTDEKNRIAALIKNGVPEKQARAQVGCTTSCKDLLIQIAGWIRRCGQLSGGSAKAFSPLVFNLPAAGMDTGAWHYIGEAGDGDNSKPDGILMPRPGDFYQVQGPGVTPGMHVGVILEFDFGRWTTLQGGQGGPMSDFIKRSAHAFSAPSILGWLDLDKYFPGWTPRES